MKKIFLSITLVGLTTGILHAKPAVAGCNAFGCSRSEAADCNAFGCPKSPMGEECSAFGCPPSEQPVSAPAPTPPATAPLVVYPNQSMGGSPEGIPKCMQKLLYERKLVCTRDSCSRIPREGFGGWQSQNVRTDLSESAAAQACQNAR
jgi:hypothetical protein